ncbi:MAG: methyltransferase domain-containing protein [bacterium]|nr:methyltransferase domain-containing protein [bacterium]
MTDTHTFGKPFDRGCTFLHNSDRNPFVDFAKNQKLAADPVPADRHSQIWINQREASTRQYRDISKRQKLLGKAIADTAQTGALTPEANMKVSKRYSLRQANANHPCRFPKTRMIIELLLIQNGEWIYSSILGLLSNFAVIQVEGMNNDDKLLQNKSSVLGNPPPVIEKFFEDFGPRPRRVLDFGCGHGRNALFIAGLGHEVVAVDRTLRRIRDLTAMVKQERLNISVEIGNIGSFEPDGTFDVVLIDRSLLPLREYDRLMLFNKLVDHVHVGGWMLIEEGKGDLENFRQILNTHEARWMIDKLEQGYLFASRLEE